MNWQRELYRLLTSRSMRGTASRLRGMGGSLVAHGLLLYGLFCLNYNVYQPPKAVRIAVDVPERAVADDFLMEVLSDDFSEKAPGAAAGGGGFEASKQPTATLPSPSRPAIETSLATLTRLEASTPSRPLAHLEGEIGLGDVVPGVIGETLESTSVEGAVDRITAEILRQLRKGPVMLVWLVDASGSLRERRQAVFDRFDHVVQELTQLGKMKDEILLSTVLSFGSDTAVLIPKPTSDSEALKQAVRSIPDDVTGQENVFAAVRTAARSFRRHQTQSHRTLMMIVVTDEAGDDLPALDDCLQLVRRNRVPVYVLGPMAPFGRRTINVPWVDEPTGEVFEVPIDRGPETVLPEHLAVPYWSQGPQYDLFPSGFGPFGLTMLARASGGIYFLFDDGRIPGPRFDRAVLDRYAPDYLSLAAYEKELEDRPLRRGILQVVRMTEETLGQPRMVFPMEDLNANLSDAQRTVAATLTVVDRAVELLEDCEEHRKKEDSLRWKAHFDLVLGRLLATRIRCNEYNWALAQMKVNPPRAEGKNNHWRLVENGEIRFGKSLVTKGKEKRDSKITEQARKDAERALELLERAQAENAGTPWAMLAARESKVPLGFAWEQFFIPPPPEIEIRPSSNEPPPKRGPTPREEAAKRVGKL